MTAFSSEFACERGDLDQVVEIVVRHEFGQLEFPFEGSLPATESQHTIPATPVARGIHDGSDIADREHLASVWHRTIDELQSALFAKAGMKRRRGLPFSRPPKTPSGPSITDAKHTRSPSHDSATSWQPSLVTYGYQTFNARCFFMLPGPGAKQNPCWGVQKQIHRRGRRDRREDIRQRSEVRSQRTEHGLHDLHRSLALLVFSLRPLRSLRSLR
jgi:hypothetical protein